MGVLPNIWLHEAHFPTPPPPPPPLIIIAQSLKDMVKPFLLRNPRSIIYVRTNVDPGQTFALGPYFKPEIYISLLVIYKTN